MILYVLALINDRNFLIKAENIFSLFRHKITKKSCYTSAIILQIYFVIEIVSLMLMSLSR